MFLTAFNNEKNLIDSSLNLHDWMTEPLFWSILFNFRKFNKPSDTLSSLNSLFQLLLHIFNFWPQARKSDVRRLILISIRLLFRLLHLRLFFAQQISHNSSFSGAFEHVIRCHWHFDTWLSVVRIWKFSGKFGRRVSTGKLTIRSILAFFRVS